MSDKNEINLDRLTHFIRKWSESILPAKDPVSEVTEPPDGRFSIVLFFLKVLPWFTGILFCVSIFYDLEGTVNLPWRSDPVKLDGLLRMLSVTGLIGFGTNWLAIKMLFHPRYKRPILGQGLIPSRKERIALKLGQSISREIINPHLILDQIRDSGLVTRHRENFTRSLRDMVHDPDFVQDLIELSEHYITLFLRSEEFRNNLRTIVRGIDFENMSGIEGGFVKFYRFIQGDKEVADRLEDYIENITFRMDRYEEDLISFLESLPGLVETKGHVAEDYILNGVIFLLEQIDVQSVVTDNIRKLDEQRLENLLLNSTSDQLQYIQYLGCFLGLIGGLFIWQPVESAVVFGGIVAGMFALDALIFKFSKKYNPR